MQGILRNCRRLARLSRTRMVQFNSNRLLIRSARPALLSECVSEYRCLVPGLQCKQYSNNTVAHSEVDAVRFEKVCEETLESLCDYFEELVENCAHLKGSDVTFGDGVLTVVFGEAYGTYVINRQTPNKQIWLSSPTSGPKRYDFVSQGNGYWIYKHDGVTLHQLLQQEISKIVRTQTDFSLCSHSLL